MNFDILSVMLAPINSTWLEIDLDAIGNNIRRIAALTGKPVMPVIKANAYGHGLVPVARAAVRAGAPYLAVARITEALALREAGIALPLLVLGFCTPERVPDALRYDITLTMYHPDLLEPYSRQAAAAGHALRVHVKIDSGMGRLGVFAENGLEFIQQVHSNPWLEWEGLFTHMARADEPVLDTTHQQLQRFDALVRALDALDLRPRWVHAANSASCLYFPESRYDMVRPGIAIYGLEPSELAPLPQGFQTALSWKARLASVKTLPQGHGIGYNHRYYTAKAERIGVIPVGYADGFRRRLGNFVLVGGKQVPVTGGVCMDQCMVQLDDVPEAQVGDEVVLIGRQGDACIRAEDLGSAWGTINYEVVCGLAERLTRVYRAESE